MPWYITDKGYSAMQDQTAKGEACDAICQDDQCIENCEKCRVYV